MNIMKRPVAPLLRNKGHSFPQARDYRLNIVSLILLLTTWVLRYVRVVELQRYNKECTTLRSGCYSYEVKLRICKSKGLVKLYVSKCSKLESLPEEIGDLENLEELDASYTLISRPPSSIVRLNKLKSLAFQKRKSEDRVYFVFPLVNKGLLSLEILDLSYCNIIDGELPEDIGSLSSLKELNLCGNKFEHLPQSISELDALRFLDLSDCKRLTQLPEDIGCLSSLKHLNLSGNNFEYLPQSISELRALRFLHFSDCKRLTQLPEFPKQLDTICRLEQ
ncbi:hypothetical protein MTR67_046557 [Solanum verrucosum]|uniref:Disease resistance R13L4/SHOC-2-like LRR domain-containing protein n=1 Tax=Solanum verrucosum TaxID=315347 RepID=A0AAF0UVF1_SOLVR|nr:hypothetical protein MTR67_046557 [Solanum verrucosum]